MKYRCLQCEHDGPCTLELVMVTEPINTPRNCPFGGSAKWDGVGPEQKYGCHYEDDDSAPCMCVIDTDDKGLCFYASEVKSKEECKYWRVIK